MGSQSSPFPCTLLPGSSTSSTSDSRPAPMTPAAIVRSSSWFLRHVVIDFVVRAGARDRRGCVVTICGAPVDRAQRIHQTPPNTSTTRPPSHRPPRTRNDCTHTHTHRYAPPPPANYIQVVSILRCIDVLIFQLSCRITRLTYCNFIFRILY